MFCTSPMAARMPRNSPSSVGLTKKPFDAGSSSGTPPTLVETMTQPELEMRQGSRRYTKASRTVMLKDSVREQDR